ncbi:Ankyrin repeat and BTB/POZ domain-containing protein 2 [Quaeritorhiza haematococci]|nr:Ankyrin repeat and BTB/POZ domain-containing protein 2 [Quaeritorhiza haematococci]
MVKVGEVFSWQISEIIPLHTPFQQGKKHRSQPFETANGQQWCVLVDTGENDIGVHLEAAMPIIAAARIVFSMVLTGGVFTTFSAEGLTFTPEIRSWGWKQFVRRDQWISFLRSSFELKLRIPYRDRDSPDSTRDFYTSMVNNEKDSDCSFLVEGKKIYALSPILCNRSPYFKAMLQTDFTEGKFSKDRLIELSNLTYAAVLSCMKWMYTGWLPRQGATFGEAWDVYTAADMLGLDDLSKGALAVISSTIALNTFGDIYVFARTFQQPKLASKALAYWKENWAKTRRKRTKANQQAKTIIEHMGSSGEDEELWAFAKAPLGDGAGGSN